MTRRGKADVDPLRWLLLALLAIGVGYWCFQHFASFGARSSPKGSVVDKRGAGGLAPVHTILVEKHDFPVYLNGLGTVQAANTVTVRSRVDGQIAKVAFEEGQMVQTGDLLVQIDPAPFQAALDQALAKIAQDKANLANAQQDLQRTSTLAKQGNATQQLLDQRAAAVASQTALVQADEAAIESAKVQLGYTTIKSPLTGRAGFRLIDPGNIVHANDQNGILTITQLQPIAVVFTASEQELPAIQEAMQSGALPVTAMSSDGQKVLGDGKLQLIDNQVDVASGTIRLKALFDNSNKTLWPGLSVTTRLLLRTIKNVVVVPAKAVKRGPNGLYAYVIDNQSKAQQRSLKVNHFDDTQALVEEGLNPGDRLVTTGQYRVQPGGPVQLLDDQNRNATATSATEKAE